MVAPVQLRERAYFDADQRLGVDGRNLGAAGIPVLQVRQSCSQHRSLELVQPAVDALGDVAVAVGLSVLAHEAKTLRELWVVRHDRPAVTERGEILRRVEAEAAEPADRSRGPSPKIGACGLRAILHDLDPAARRARRSPRRLRTGRTGALALPRESSLRALRGAISRPWSRLRLQRWRGPA